MRALSLFAALAICLMFFTQHLSAAGSTVSIDHFTFGYDDGGKSLMLIEVRNQGMESAEVRVSIDLLKAKSNAQNEYSYHPIGHTQVSGRVIVDLNKQSTVRIPYPAILKPGDYSALVRTGQGDANVARFDFSINRQPAPKEGHSEFHQSSPFFFTQKSGFILISAAFTIILLLWIGTVYLVRHRNRRENS
ncbi:hypothetical protein [Paenibacillus camerounensis]|uniref:hypothetical protein n=1 Tax=Paenibacillus camerounensis TaxID=1243663 RepID=UPI0005A9D18E|nr:hypothetical protein [Paenibacillus camerounensis]